MSKRTIVLETSKRVYHINENNGIWTAHFTPVNPKTGKPWQATRHLPGSDCYRMAKYGQNDAPLIFGEWPGYEAMRTAGCDWCREGWSTPALATEACFAHARKSKLI